MTLERDVIETILESEPAATWSAIVERLQDICREGFDGEVVRSVIDREIAVGEIDDVISTAAWDLWESFQGCVPRTSQKLKEFWQRPHENKAILILDGLSLREMPHILEGAVSNGLQVVRCEVTASEIPPETDAFANALGFPSRSSLRNHPGSIHFQEAKTAVTDMEWGSCRDIVGADPNLIFWHTFPDDRLHALEKDGDALGRLSKEIGESFRELSFWEFVTRLATGRTLIITSDHGYAAGGYFHDVPSGPTEFLKETFKGSRHVSGAGPIGEASPPLVISLPSSKGIVRLTLGRRKWPVPGGFPKLTHGGLTLFEVLSPYIEIKRESI